ncbi:MAG TPA: DNA polymerase/3'-5' exonuclease PolX [Acidimicrobiia bacterium]
MGAALSEHADLLALTGADAFKVRVYEKAARSVAGYHADIATLDEEGLREIPGVGKSIAAKIVEILDHGSFNELDEERARVPAGVRSLLDVPGLGPKRAVQLHDELGVSSIPELLDALHEHRLRDLHGFGERTEQALVEAIRHLQAAGGRVRLDVALDLAETILDDLRMLPQVRQATYAGSLRRMCATIGDLDLLVAADDADPVMDAFCSMPLVDQVLAHGPTKSSVHTTKGLQVDVRVVPQRVWGAALQYFTGSKAHNIRLRAIAIKKGLKLSEYGLFRVESNRSVAAATEEDVYRRLGLPWVPPPLREDRGEIEAALDDSLPHLVETSDLRGDLHGHTDLTDGLASLEEMVDAARARGHEYYAVTDHAPMLYMDRMTSERALRQRAALRRLQRDDGPVLLHGSELNIQPDGSLDWDDEFLASFDVLVASVHSHFTQPRDELTRRIIRAIEHPYVNIIGHPTGRLIGKRPAVDVDFDEIFRVAARTGTALEINSFPDRLDLDDEHVRRARDAGVRFAIDTDAHAVPHLGNLRFGVATAQRGWVDREHVVNAWPLPRLRGFLAKGRSVP